MKVRKKPAVVEAVQWHRYDEPPEGLFLGPHGPPTGATCLLNRPHLHTLEGVVFDVGLHDWIVTGIMGERYPVKPAIFAATYDFVDP